jgi:putative Mn2+ efflux pump MntP
MTLISLLLTAVALSMDAFAVAIGKGLSIKKLQLKHALLVGAWFGIFQAIMPLIGYFLGDTFGKFIDQFDHWIAFALLVLIGINMIRESLSKKEEEIDASLSPKKMFVLAVSTSIDALATGAAFAFAGGTNIWLAIAIIGVTTFVLSAVGVKIGNAFGSKYKSKAELVGGIVLIGIGVEILVKALFF